MQASQPSPYFQAHIQQWSYDLCTLFCNSDPGTIQVWLQGFHSYLELKRKRSRKGDRHEMFFAGVKQWFLRCDAKDTRNREKMIHLTELFLKKYASNTTTKERKRNQKNAKEEV